MSLVCLQAKHIRIVKAMSHVYTKLARPQFILCQAVAVSAVVLPSYFAISDAICQRHVVSNQKSLLKCSSGGDAGTLGFVVLLEHLRVLMYLYHVFSILQLTTVGLLMVRFWRKW